MARGTVGWMERYVLSVLFAVESHIEDYSFFQKRVMLIQYLTVRFQNKLKLEMIPGFIWFLIFGLQRI